MDVPSPFVCPSPSGVYGRYNSSYSSGHGRSRKRVTSRDCRSHLVHEVSEGQGSSSLDPIRIWCRVVSNQLQRRVPNNQGKGRPDKTHSWIFQDYRSLWESVSNSTSTLDFIPSNSPLPTGGCRRRCLWFTLGPTPHDL